MRRRGFLASVTGAVAAVAGCLGSASSTDDYDVGMSSRAFAPEAIEVAPGETVVWRNTSGRRHTVTANERRLPDGADFFSTGEYPTHEAAHEAWTERLQGALDPGATFTYTFEVPGDHFYHCLPHESAGMRGVVRVRE